MNDTKKEYELLEDPDHYSICITDDYPNWSDLQAVGVESICIKDPAASNYLSERLYTTEMKRKTLLLFFDDNDKESRQNKTDLIGELNAARLQWKEWKPPKGYSSLTDFLSYEPNARQLLIQSLEAEEHNAAPKPDSLAGYMANKWKKDLQQFQQAGNLKTGFAILDENLHGIFPAVYTIGATSSQGKTTFVHQISDALARAGNHVLFFSLEQSASELVSKSISRESYRISPNEAKTSIQIRRGQTNKTTDQAAEKYLSYAGNTMNIIEGNFGTTAGWIREYTKKYIERNKVRPVIIVDYLQVVAAEIDPETKRKPQDAKAVTDHNMVELKRLSRDENIPVFVVSSFNRMNYGEPASYESFKESGIIEYTSDVVLALQFQVIGSKAYQDEKNVSKRREMIDNAKQEYPQQVQIVCLKNRYGRKDWSVDFDYYNRNDLFIEKLPRIIKTY